MEKQSIINQFDDYYIRENRIKQIDDLSYNLPLTSISVLNKNQIKIGSKEVNIPDSVLQSIRNNNIKLDAFTNDNNNTYYVNPHYKKYYKIGDDISVSNYKLEENNILSLDFKYEMYNDLSCHFVVIEFSKEKGILARRYNDLNHVSILPHSETKYLKVFLVPENEGFIYNMDMQIDKKNMVVLNNTFLEVNSDIVYNPNGKVMFTHEEDNLIISVPELNKSFIYFSYGIQNNSFNKLPKQSLIKINPNKLYKITTPFTLHNEIDFTPTLIEYNNQGKTNLIKLTNDDQFIRFQNDTSAIRLSYRFSGVGKVEVHPINIIEYETETEYETVTWDSRYEIDSHMKTLKSIKDFRIAVIMDEFTYHSYKFEADLLKLSFDNWKNEIISFMPHFIFIESSWHGNNGDWSKKIAYVTDEKHSYIKELISFAKAQDIPVVFWNKEDPVHFDHFIHTARLCDFVFTTDRDRIDDYKMVCNHENVDVLQFAAQPVNHNPIKIQKERVDGISFAGSYYGLREERSADMDRLFKASIPHNLYIYDRNYEYTKKGERLNFLFPEEFRKYILGTLPFYEIEKAYKGYRYMININTVKDSPTMYARRVYEGLASGTPIISNGSIGMVKQFGDIIGHAENEGELSGYLTTLNQSESKYNKVKQLGIRKVLSEHTYTHRLSQIALKLGYSFSSKIKKVTVLSFVESDINIEKIISKYKRINYLDKELILIVNSDIQDYSLVNDKVSVISENRVIKSFETLNKLIDSDYIMPLNVDDFYAENYLIDLILSETYSNSDIIGKYNYYEVLDNVLEEINRNHEHEFTDNINLDSSIIHRNVFSNFNLIESFQYLKNEKEISDLRYLGYRIFSTDKMNYIKNGNGLSSEVKNNVIV